MKLVMIGGHSRNIGKTSVVSGIIAGLRELGWTAAKITQFGHGVCSVNGEVCGCSVSEHQFSITEERQLGTGTDTSRFLAAGARRSLWIRTKQGELVSALPAFTRRIEADEFVIVESNSLRRFMKPELYIQVLEPANPDFKVSAQQFFDLSDAYILVRKSGQDEPIATDNALLAGEIEKNKPYFVVREENQFMSKEVIDFVRSRLAVGASDITRRLQPAH
jgi:molybdopterin-guanine dinucleotide biosynthesis protein